MRTQKMKMPLYIKYGETKAIGVIPMSNFGGIEILDMDSEYIVACFNFGTGRQQIRRHKIEASCSGRNYFRKQGRRYYFDEVLNVG